MNPGYVPPNDSPEDRAQGTNDQPTTQWPWSTRVVVLVTGLFLLCGGCVIRQVYIVGPAPTTIIERR